MDQGCQLCLPFHAKRSDPLATAGRSHSRRSPHLSQSDFSVVYWESVNVMHEPTWTSGSCSKTPRLPGLRAGPGSCALHLHVKTDGFPGCWDQQFHLRTQDTTEKIMRIDGGQLLTYLSLQVSPVPLSLEIWMPPGSLGGAAFSPILAGHVGPESLRQEVPNKEPPASEHGPLLRSRMPSEGL